MKRREIIMAMVFLAVTTVSVIPAAGRDGPESAGYININTATEEQLKMLPLINDQLAHDIVLYRFSNGPFFTVDELLNVHGMTQEKLDVLRPWLVTEGDTTFSPDLYQESQPKQNY